MKYKQKINAEKNLKMFAQIRKCVCSGHKSLNSGSDRENPNYRFL